MSRIHEALKKAEQDRAAMARSENSASPADLLKTATAVAEPIAPAPVKDEELRTPGRPITLTLDSLRQNCRQVRWNPNPKTVVFSGGQDHAAGAEEFRTLRSRLYKTREKQKLQIVLISSALPEEGKTFVASNLAQVIARQHERRALLIDADLRKSRLHTTLGAPETPGLSEFLAGDVDEFAAMQRGQQDNLFFIPGGKPCRNPAELIGNGRLKSLLQRAAHVFDWIIFDSPPVVPVSDATLLAEMCDGVLIVVRSAMTPYDVAQKACQEFRDKHLLGVVLNRMPTGEAYGSYYSQYGYGYGQKPKNEKGKDQER